MRSESSQVGPDPHAAHPAAQDHDDDGRRESKNQRMDRNWNELLQEFRVVQTGTQILSGFLLAIAFQPRFADLDRFQLTVYCTLVLLAVATTLCALVPVSLHRALFRRGRKSSLVRAAHRIMRLVLIGVGMLLAGSVLLIFDWAVGRTAGLVASGAVTFVVVVVAVAPILVWTHPHRNTSTGHDG